MTTDEKVEKIQEIIKLKVLGVWEKRHTEAGHRYANLQTGHIVDSVTTQIGAVIAKPHLIKWAIKMALNWLLEGDRLEKLRNIHSREEMFAGAMLAHTDFRDEAGSVGSLAHSGVERWLNDGIASGVLSEDITKFAVVNCDPRAIAAMRSVEKLFKDKNITPIATELLVGDIRYSAGQLDSLVFWENDLCLLDWKSSNQVSQEYILQAVAYLKFFESMTLLKIKKIKIVQMNKDQDKYTVYNVGNIAASWRAFKQLCGLYKWRKDRKNVLEKDVKRISI